jgi:hypothetical protein
MCELVFLNLVNICGRILELTPKNGYNLANFELAKELPDLTKFPHSIEVLYWFWNRVGATASRVAPGRLARLNFESRHVTWRDSCSPFDLLENCPWLPIGATAS